MKKFFKPIAVLFSAALFLTSCVDNTVSDIVNQIRTNQNALLAARVQLAAAEAKTKEISNAYAEASNAILLDRAESDAATQIAYNAQQQKYYEQQLKAAELALEQSIQDLADYLATKDLDQAQQYLSDYQSALSDILDLRFDALDAQDNINDYNAMLAAGNYQYDLIQEYLARDKADLESDLAAAEDALEILEGVAEDPASAQAELATLLGDIQALENANDLLDIDITKKQEEKSNADDELSDATTLIDDFEGWQDQVEADQDAVDAQNDLLADLGDDKTAAAKVLSDATTVYNNAKNGRAPFSSDVDDAEDAVDAAEATLNLKQAAYDLAVAKNTANPTTANQAAEDAALTARDNAADDLTDANTDLTDAQTALDDFDNSLPKPVDDENDFNTVDMKDDVRNAQDAVDNINQAIEDGNEDLAEAEETLEDDTNKVTAHQTAYDDAVADLPALEDAVDTLVDELTALDDEQDANDDMIDEKENVADAIDGTLDDINESIEDKKDEIENIKYSLSFLIYQINQNSYDKEFVEGQLANEEEYLGNINSEIADTQALADEWKALLDALIG